MRPPCRTWVGRHRGHGRGEWALMFSGRCLQRHGRIVALGAPFAGSWEMQRMVDGTQPLASCWPGGDAAHDGRKRGSSARRLAGSVRVCAEPHAGDPRPICSPLLAIAGTGIPSCVNVRARPGCDTADLLSRRWRWHRRDEGHARDRRAGRRHRRIARPPGDVRAGNRRVPRRAGGGNIVAGTGDSAAGEGALEAHEDPLPEVISSVELIETAIGALSP